MCNMRCGVSSDSSNLRCAGRDRPGLIERLEAKRDRHKVPAVSLWDNLVPAQELKSGAASSFTFSFGE